MTNPTPPTSPEPEPAEARFAHIAPPADAKQILPWETAHDEWFRTFDGTVRKVGGMEFAIRGTQHSDGSVRRVIAVVQGAVLAVDANEARQIAAALVNAADEIEQLSES